MDIIATIMSLIRRKNWITPVQLTTDVVGPGLSGGNGTAITVVTDGSTIGLNGSNQLELKNQAVGPSKLGAIAGSGLSGGNGVALSVADGAVSTRQTFTLSYNGGVTVGGGAWEVKASAGFSIPASSQPVLVQWYWSGSNSAALSGNQGVALGIDGIPLVSVVTTSANTSWPGGFGNGTATPTPVYVNHNVSPRFGSGGHTLQLWLHGTSGTGGGSMNCTVTVTLMYVYK